jgi:hypothetical protein
LNGVSEKYSDCISELKIARVELAHGIIDLEQETQRLAVAKARAEQKVIDNLGNGKAKAVGSSADDRARVLILHTDGDEEYKKARERFEEVQRKVALLKAEKESIEDKAKLISIESDNYLRDALREFAQSLTKLVSGRIAEAAVGRNKTTSIGGLV